MPKPTLTNHLGVLLKLELNGDISTILWVMYISVFAYGVSPKHAKRCSAQNYVKVNKKHEDETQTVCSTSF